MYNNGFKISIKSRKDILVTSDEVPCHELSGAWPRRITLKNVGDSMCHLLDSDSDDAQERRNDWLCE